MMRDDRIKDDDMRSSGTRDDDVLRPGDRIQMVECADPYAPILPGTRGTVAYVDSQFTAHMRWDNGRTLGVCPDEDEVRRIDPMREAEALNAVAAPACDEAQFDAHCEENGALIDALYAYALETEGEWVIRSSFLDEANKGRDPVFEFTGSGSVFGLLDRCDVKNGVDILAATKRPAKEQSILLVAYGQNYSMPDGTSGILTQLIECKLASPAAARDFHERLDRGWKSRGEAAMKLFNSPKDQVGLSSCIQECKTIMHGQSKDRGVER